MENLGNLEGFVMTSNPPMWYETYICNKCMIKKTELISGDIDKKKKVDLNLYKDYNDFMF